MIISFYLYCSIVLLPAIVVVMHVEGLFSLEEFVGVFYMSVRSAEVGNYLQFRCLLRCMGWNAATCDIYLDSMFSTIELPFQKVSIWF